MKKTRVLDIVNGPLLPNIIRFATPVMLSALLEMLFNATDTIIVGKFSGQQALAAVGATGSIIFFITSLFNGLSSGANVVIAKYLGAGDDEKVYKAVHTSIFMGVLGGMFIILVGELSTPYFLRLMSTPEDIIAMSTLYMRIYWLGQLFILTYDFGSAILRSKGDTQRPFYFLTISGFINVVLNLFFVVVLKMSVSGVAIATVISHFIAGVLMIRTLLHEEDCTRLYPKEIAFHKEQFLEMVRIGVPAGIQGMIFSLSNVVIQSEINKLGSVVVAGNSAAANIENFVYIGMIGFSQAAITFTSQNIGAKRFERVLPVMLITLGLNIAFSFGISFVVDQNSSFFLSFYTNDMAVKEAGEIRTHIVTLWLFLNAILDIFVCSMRGMGKSFGPTLVSLVGITGVRLGYIAYYYPNHPGLASLYRCFPLSWIVTAIIQGIFWFVIYHKMNATRKVEV